MNVPLVKIKEYWTTGPLFVPLSGNSHFSGGGLPLLHLCRLVLLVLFSCCQPAFAASPQSIPVHAAMESHAVLPGHIIFKLTPEAQEQKGGLELLSEHINGLSGTKIMNSPYRLFPRHDAPSGKSLAAGRPLVDLSRIYEVVIDDHDRLPDVITAIALTGLTEYVQPRFIPETQHFIKEHTDTVYVPNDPMAPDQYYLDNIAAYQAWAISRGDTNTVIAIVDTGVDLYHPDLVNAIKYNYDDPINSEDSDGDGYIDNFHGWDLGEGNNDPTFNRSAHGLHVSGIAAASADNDEGIAGVGFHSRFLPVKVDDEFGRLVKAYEGIVYAADQGVDVINCSWGSHFYPGPFGQDIIDYAVFNRDVLVVAAAGNANSSQPFYPASLDHVVSVAATDTFDRKTGFSSYGAFVDVTAPGIGIKSTWVYNTYMSSGGTSMASPIVAGAAAILRSYYPAYDAMQIAALLKLSSDPVDEVQGNADYGGQLGYGRINLLKALTETGRPYVRVVEDLSGEENLKAVRPGDQFEVAVQFQNILAPAGNFSAVLTTPSDYLDVLTDTLWFGGLDSMAFTDNAASPFIVNALSDLPVNHETIFVISFFDGGGQTIGRHALRHVLNSDYVNIHAGAITTTISSLGALGFNYPYYSQGKGLLYNNGYTMLQCGGIVVGNSVAQVVDNIYGARQGSFSEVLKPLRYPRVHTTHPVAPIKVSGSVTDQTSNHSGPLNVEISYRAYFWDDNPAEDFFILDYAVINHSEKTYNNLYAGFFADWVLRNNKMHRAGIHVPARLAYAFSEEGGHYAGIQLLTGGGMRHYAFDKQGAGGSMQISKGFTDFKKFTALTSNRFQAGHYKDDNNISSLLSSGPHFVHPGDTVMVSFAIHLAEHLPDMIKNTEKAREYYHMLESIPTSVSPPPLLAQPELLKAYPNPFSSQLTVSINGEPGHVYRLTMADLYGRKVYAFNVGPLADMGKKVKIPVQGLHPGIYVIRLDNGYENAAVRVIKW